MLNALGILEADGTGVASGHALTIAYSLFIRRRKPRP
jgi:hypothetical protein